MAACGSKSGSVESGSRNNWTKVQEWKTCAVTSCSALQEEQGGLLVNLNAHIYLFK